MLRKLQDDQPPSPKDKKQAIFYGALMIICVLCLLVLLFLVIKWLYRKYYLKGRRESLSKLKKTEAIKSIYDDKFVIIEQEHENMKDDKSMIKEFLEANLKKDDPNLKKDDKNFYISAKNVFNIEGEESEYHYDTAKKYTNRENSKDSNEMEDEMGQFSQELEKNHEENMSNMRVTDEKLENSFLNVLN